MAKDKTDLLQGTLDMLILRALSASPMHGFGIATRIHQMSHEALIVEQGSLYPALYRLEAQRWIRSEWGLSDNNRKARFYSLTKAGIRQLELESANWTRLANAINLVMGLNPQQ
jgi:PadR family transcriptional regulator, regulatory protein PadR